MNVQYSIVGGGIAGLTLANLLQKNKIPFQVYDKSPAINPKGHGFIIPQEGLVILSEILDWDQIIRKGNYIHLYEAFNDRGELLASIDTGGVFAISRPALLESLYERIDPAQVHFNKEIEQVTVKGQQIRAIQFTDQTTIRPEMVVASDGVGSMLRKQIFPTSNLESVGYHEVVCTIEHPALVEFLGKRLLKFHHHAGGRAFGMLKISPTKLIWYVQFDTQRFPLPSGGASVLKQFIEQYFGDWCAPVQAVIQASDFQNAHHWQLFELHNLPTYAAGNTILLGDAAHPVLPFTSQGVVSAQKDAKVLTELIKSKLEQETLFSTYSETRMAEMQEHFDNGKAMMNNFLLPLKQQSVGIPMSVKIPAGNLRRAFRSSSQNPPPSGINVAI
jgi:2-polyprenyl-6-methoxyphenol hydroxylase-like FAD-dependent oxidoreductase